MLRLLNIFFTWISDFIFRKKKLTSTQTLKRLNNASTETVGIQNPMVIIRKCGCQQFPEIIMSSSDEAFTNMMTEELKFSWIIKKWKMHELFYSPHKNVAMQGPTFKSKIFSGVEWSLSLQFATYQGTAQITGYLKTETTNFSPKIMKGELSFFTDEGVKLRSTTFCEKTYNQMNISASFAGSKATTMSEDLKIVAKFQLMVHDQQSNLHYKPLPPWRHLTSSSHKQLVNDISSLTTCNSYPTDLTIRVQKETFQGHVAVFAARSPVFRAMLDTPMQEKLTRTVTIVDTSPDTWRLFQHFLYSAEVTFDASDVALSRGLLMLAEKYGVTSLIEELETRLASVVGRDNALEVFDLAERYRLSWLRDVAIHVFEQHMDFFKKEKKEEFLKRIVGSPALASSLVLG